MKILISILLLFNFTVLGQSEQEAKDALITIVSLEQVDSLKRDHPDWYITVKKTLPEGYSYDSLLFNKEVGNYILTQYSEKAPIFQNKVIQHGKEDVCKANYIYLDGSKHSIQEIDKLRATILKKFNDGVSFVNLVKKYNEDGNSTGELPWFYRGMMVDEFDTAVRERNSGEIFMVDVPNKNWYYVVLKTDENKKLDCTYSVGIKLGHNVK